MTQHDPQFTVPEGAVMPGIGDSPGRAANQRARHCDQRDEARKERDVARALLEEAIAQRDDARSHIEGWRLKSRSADDARQAMEVERDALREACREALSAGMMECQCAEILERALTPESASCGETKPDA